MNWKIMYKLGKNDDGCKTMLTLWQSYRKEQFKASFINLLWSCCHVFLEKWTSWSGGYMSVKADAQPLKKSVVKMLPVINLSATNMTALDSLLCFVVEQSKKQQTAYAFHHV